MTHKTKQSPNGIIDLMLDIEQVASALNVSVEDLDLKQYGSNGGIYDGRSMRRFGGFDAAKLRAAKMQQQNKFGLSAPESPGALAADDGGGADESAQKLSGASDATTAARQAQRNKLYVSKLEREVSDMNVFAANMLNGFKDLFEKTQPVIVSKTPAKPPVKPSKVQTRANGVLISDIHLGLKISKDEVMTNEYSWEIAARRLGKLTEQVAKYKADHRHECGELHVCLGGDLGQGVIHLTDSNTDLITHQIWGIVSYLTQMIDYWRGHYKTIVVHCTPDNHLRLPHKGPDRALAQKFDSFSAFIHMGLQLAFRDAPEVTFDVPKTAITTFSVLGHKFGLTHGDTHVNSGNVGQSVNVKSIVNQILRLNAAQQDNKHYDAFLLGHVHVPLFMHLNETRTQLIINGTGSGTDPYAESAGFYQTRPTQVIWESTDTYPVGDFRIVDLSDADKDSRYESIIKAYDYSLSFDNK